MAATSGETSERTAAPYAAVSVRTLRRDPLWWVISVLPAVVLLRVAFGGDGPPVGVGEWLLAGIFALATSTLVAVVLLGVRRGWRLSRSGPGTEEDRATRRARSRAVAEILVGTATLLLIVAVTLWLVVSAR